MCERNKRRTKPGGSIRLGAIDVTEPDKFIWFGNIYDPRALLNIVRCLKGFLFCERLFFWPQDSPDKVTPSP